MTNWIEVGAFWAVLSIIDVVAISMWIKVSKSPAIKNKGIGLLLPFGMLSAMSFAVQVFAVKLASFNIAIVPVAVVLYVDMLVIVDIINENYGRKVAFLLAVLSFIPGALMLGFSYLTTIISSPSFAVIPAWNSIFSFDVRIGLASFFTFFVDYLFDTRVYAKFKQVFNGKKLYVRYLVAELPTLVIDSFVFITLAFYGTTAIMPLIEGQIEIKYLLGIPAIGLMYLSKYIVGRDSSSTFNQILKQ